MVDTKNIGMLGQFPSDLTAQNYAVEENCFRSGVFYYNPTLSPPHFRYYDGSIWRDYDICEKELIIPLFDANVDVAIGDSNLLVGVGDVLNGYNIVNVIAIVNTPGVTNTTDIALRRKRGATTVEVLSTPVTINSGDYSASNGVVDTSNDDLLSGDVLFVDVDAVSTTPPKGLCAIIRCKKV